MIRWSGATAEYVVGPRRRPRWSVSVAAGVPVMVVGTLVGLGQGGWPLVGGAVVVAGGAVFVGTTVRSSRSTPRRGT